MNAQERAYYSISRLASWQLGYGEKCTEVFNDDMRVVLELARTQMGLLDQTPIDEAALLALGFIQAPGPDWLWSGGNVYAAWNRVDKGWVIGGPGDDEEVALDAPPTLGQLRALLFALAAVSEHVSK